MIEYDPKLWKRGENVTMEQFCNYAESHVPPGAVLHICGSSQFYLHVSKDGGMVSLDDCTLSDMPEYENEEPCELEQEDFIQ